MWPFRRRPRPVETLESLTDRLVEAWVLRVAADEATKADFLKAARSPEWAPASFYDLHQVGALALATRFLTARLSPEAEAELQDAVFARLRLKAGDARADQYREATRWGVPVKSDRTGREFGPVQNTSMWIMNTLGVFQVDYRAVLTMQLMLSFDGQAIAFEATQGRPMSKQEQEAVWARMAPRTA